MGDYFVKIEDSTDVRRKVLESSKDALHIMRDQQKIHVIRGEKIALLNQLRGDMRELTLLINKAEGMLPAVADTELGQLRKTVEKTPMKVRQTPKRQSEQERLEAALAHIEQKLGEMEK